MRPQTLNHPDLNSHWVGAGHLKVGDKIRKADGTFGTVANVTTVQETRTMYNLEVQEAHTFFVGTQGWLVHNCKNRLMLGWDNESTISAADRLKADFLGGNTNYAQLVKDALRSKDTRISVYVDDMLRQYGDIETAMETMVGNVENSYRGKGLAPAPTHDGFGYSATDWEMYMIYKSGRGFAGVDFIRDGGGGLVKMVNPYKK